MILGKSGTGRGRDDAHAGGIGIRTVADIRGCGTVMASIAALGRIGKLCVIELLPDAIILTTIITLVGLDNIDHHLGILLLLIFGNTIVG